MNTIEMPKKRSDMRLCLGKLYYGTKRKLKWLKPNGVESLSVSRIIFSHICVTSPLDGNLMDEEMIVKKLCNNDVYTLFEESSK